VPIEPALPALATGSSNVSVFVAVAQWLWARAWILLIFSMAVWGANGTAARLATNAISPMLLVFLRWGLVCAILFACVGREVWASLPILLADWRRLLLVGFTGFTGFNTLYYLAAYATTAVNMTVLQGVTPPLVLVGAVIFQGVRIRPLQLIGLIVSFLGIGIIATHGELSRVSSLSFNIGDLAMLAACVLYAVYTLALRDRPKVPPLVFFAAIAVAACVSSVPLAVAEIATGHSYWPGWQGWLILLFVAFGPSFTAQITYMRAITLIGPSRAGVFNNLVPVFGALFAVILLGEPVALYQGAALVLGIGGVYLAEARAGA
jgi:drug/metabolite transporter (DMT)-like permease